MRLVRFVKLSEESSVQYKNDLPLPTGIDAKSLEQIYAKVSPKIKNPGMEYF